MATCENVMHALTSGQPPGSHFWTVSRLRNKLCRGKPVNKAQRRKPRIETKHCDFCLLTSACLSLPRRPSITSVNSVYSSSPQLPHHALIPSLIILMLHIITQLKLSLMQEALQSLICHKAPQLQAQQMFVY